MPVALLLQNKLEGLNLRLFVKVSRSKGLQVYMPLNTSVTCITAGAFAQALARLLEEQHPTSSFPRWRSPSGGQGVHRPDPERSVQGHGRRLLAARPARSGRSSRSRSHGKRSRRRRKTRPRNPSPSNPTRRLKKRVDLCSGVPRSPKRCLMRSRASGSRHGRGRPPRRGLSRRIARGGISSRHRNRRGLIRSGRGRAVGAGSWSRNTAPGGSTMTSSASRCTES
jgi:hypothetical protein